MPRRSPHPRHLLLLPALAASFFAHPRVDLTRPNPPLPAARPPALAFLSPYPRVNRATHCALTPFVRPPPTPRPPCVSWSVHHTPPAGLRPPTSTPSTPITACRILFSYPGVNQETTYCILQLSTPRAPPASAPAPPSTTSTGAPVRNVHTSSHPLPHRPRQPPPALASFSLTPGVNHQPTNLSSPLLSSPGTTTTPPVPARRCRIVPAHPT